MKTMRILVVATLAAMFTLPAQDGIKPAAQDAVAKGAAANPQLIGVVDFVKAIEQYPKYIKLKGELDKRTVAAKAEINELTKRIDEQKAAASMIDDDSDEKKDRLVNIELMQAQRQAQFKRLGEKLEIEDMRIMAAVYADLEVACKKVAQARGISLVLRMHDMSGAPTDFAKMTPKTLNDVLRMYDRRQVWYAADQHDLTADLIKLLQVPLDEPKKDGKSSDTKSGDTKSGDAKTGDANAKPGEKAPVNPKPANPKTGG